MRRLPLLLSILLMLPLAAASAEVGKTWTTSGTDQFAAGKLEGVSVLSTGQVVLAPEAEQIEGLEAEFLWDVEADHRGAVYAATASPAAVFTVKGNRVELLHEAEQKQILSVLPLPDGSVLAGAAPEGLILRIDRRGKVEEFLDLEDAYVWDMVFGPDHDIYCATGPNGRLLKIGRDGKVKEELLKVKQKNVLCVAAAEDGTIYAGTDTDGYIYAVDRKGKATVLYDADESEVHALAVNEEGVVFACTAQGGRGGPSPGPPQGHPPQAMAQAPPGAQPPQGPPQQQQAQPPPAPQLGPPSAPNSIYRIRPGEGALRMVQFDSTYLLSLALVGNRVLAGTGKGGRLMAVEPDLRYRILTQFDAAFVTGLAALPDGQVIAGTANPASLWRLGQAPAEEGRLLSDTFDAGYLSRWGRIWWKQRAGPGREVRVRLRTGNSGKPDEYWSDWSGWVLEERGGPVDVPMGRFAQFHAELTTRGNLESPVLLETNVSYRGVNRKPVIDDLAINGESLLKKQGQPAGGRRRRRPSRRPPQRGAPPGAQNGPPEQETIAWKAADPNEDELAFDLYYRAVDEETWKVLEEHIREKPAFNWDTARVPDGYYLLKLVARDDPERPETEALADTKVSAPLLVDNTGPEVEELSAARRADGAYELMGVAVDGFSSIAQIEVSRNAEDWQPVFPADALLDSPRELFSHTTEELEPGEHVFVFAVTDENDNTGSARIVVVVEGE